MKFDISRELLDATLQNVSKGLSTKTPMPILTGIKIVASDKKLTFITTNRDIAIMIVLEESENLHIISNGVCVVPGKYFVEIVKKISSNIVEFTLFDSNTIKIISNNSDFTLMAFDNMNFPSPMFSIDGNPITLPSKELKQIIRQTSFACSSADSNPRIILNSMNFKIEKGKLTVVATDSFRLATRITYLNTECPNLKINVPSKSLDEFIKILPDSDENVYIYISNNQALFKIGNMSFLTRLVEGDYIDVPSLFPKNTMLQVTFNRLDLISAVDRASLFSTADKVNHVKFSFSNVSENVEIASTSTEIGRVLETVEPIHINNPRDLQLAFSAKHLLEALKSFETSEITINFAGEIRPVIITSSQCEVLSHLLVPVRSI